MERDWTTLIQQKWGERKFVCVGLDPDEKKIPPSITGNFEDRIVAFNRAIIDKTLALVCAYKPNSAFYEGYGEEGWCALQRTCEYIRKSAPDVPIILDAKRGDIGNTNEGYARMAFDVLGVDAITVQPYMGGEALAPLLSRKERGIIVLCRTSNTGAGEFQDILIEGRPLYMHVAEQVNAKWNTHRNCALVVGATAPEELARVRALVPEMPFLVPGVGAQGGDLEAVVKAGKHSLIIAVSRAVLYASSGDDFAEAARVQTEKYHNAILQTLGTMAL